MDQEQTVTMTFFRYTGGAQRWWAFKQMGLAPEAITGIRGLSFFKLLGSGGGNGFSIFPDFGRYGLLCVWDRESDARDFFSGHTVFRQFLERAVEYWTVYMRTAVVHGLWDGQVPFLSGGPYDSNRPVGVLTRATIRSRHLWRFWRFVPPVSASVGDQEGLLFSAGIGELPLVQQATFSIWTDSHHMKAFAYQSRRHREVIRRTRQTGWYKEELFARFQPFATEGSWQGKDPLKGLLQQ